MSNFLTCSSYQQLIFHTQQRRKSRHHQNHQLNNRITPRKKWKNSGKNAGLMVFRMEISNFFNVYHFLILLSWLTVTSLLCPVWPFGFVLNSFVHLSRGRNSCVSSFKGSAGFGWARPGSVGLGWAGLGWAGLGSAGLGWVRLGSARANVFDNEIYDCHSKHTLHRNSYLHPQNMSKFENKFEIISSIHPSIFMAPRQQTIIQTQKLDRMRLCFRINVRFSDALPVFNKMIQRMQDTLT